MCLCRVCVLSVRMHMVVSVLRVCFAVGYVCVYLCWHKSKCAMCMQVCVCVYVCVYVCMQVCVLCVLLTL